jgi:hypothetical protein
MISLAAAAIVTLAAATVVVAVVVIVIAWAGRPSPFHDRRPCPCHSSSMSWSVHPRPQAERSECAREHGNLVRWHQQLSETRMQHERQGGADGAWRMREVDVTPLAEMPQVEEENDGGRQQGDRRERMCRERSAVAKLTARSRRNEEGNVLDV